MQFGEKIKARREELGMTQDELAKKLGYRSRSTINKIELGINDIGQSKIIAFAKALNTTTSYLLDDCETEESCKPLNTEDKAEIHSTFIGQRIRELRINSGLSQTEVAIKLNTTKQNIYKYENSIITNIPLEKIEALAKLFNVSPSMLVGWSDNNSNTYVSEIDSLYNELNSEDKAEVRGIIKGLLRSDKYKKPKPNTNIADDMTNMLKAANFLSTKQK